MAFCTATNQWLNNKSDMERSAKTHKEQFPSKTNYANGSSENVPISLLYVMQHKYREKLATRMKGERAYLQQKAKDNSLLKISEKTRELMKTYNKNFITTQENTSGVIRRDSASGKSSHSRKLPPIELQSKGSNGNENRETHFPHGSGTVSKKTNRRTSELNNLKKHKHNFKNSKKTATGTNHEAQGNFDSNFPYQPVQSDQQNSIQTQRETTKNDNDSPPPNVAQLRILKSRKRMELLKLKNKQASLGDMHVEESGIGDGLKDNRSLTDFQKWQLEQNKDRQERLEQYHQRNNINSYPLSLQQNESITEVHSEPFSQPSQIKLIKHKSVPKSVKKRATGLDRLHQLHIGEKYNKQPQVDKAKKKVQGPSSPNNENESEFSDDENSFFDRTYSKQSGLSDQMRSFQNNFKRKDTMPNESISTMAGLQKPVLVRHDGRSTASSRTSTRNADYPQIKRSRKGLNSLATDYKNPVAVEEMMETNITQFNTVVDSNSMMISEYEDVELVPCNICGRRFNQERLKKHTSICSKTSGKKRKIYNMALARKRGTDLEAFAIVKGNLHQRPEAKQQRASWRAKHDDFIKTIRQAKAVSSYVAGGGNIADLPPPSPSINPDYIHCQYCDRRFAPKVAKRHIPKCKDVKSRPQPPKRKISQRKQ